MPDLASKTSMENQDIDRERPEGCLSYIFELKTEDFRCLYSAWEPSLSPWCRYLLNPGLDLSEHGMEAYSQGREVFLG